MEIRFHGHACCELSDGDTRLLIDPFLKPNNPSAVASVEDVDPTHIALTHGHADHLRRRRRRGEAHRRPLRRDRRAGQLARRAGRRRVSDPNLGGTIEFDWGWIKLVPAWHTSTIPGSAEAPFSAEHGISIGVATGLVIEIGGVTVYHTGDTCLFGDMKLIAERNPVDVALLPIGGHYTMDRHDAVVAAELIGAETVIPIHYDTFPPIEADAAAFKADVESRTSSKVVILRPGETHAI